MNLHKYAAPILRLGLSFVFIWFGLNQVVDQSQWVSFIPSFVIQITGLDAKTIVSVNGVFEIIAGCLLAYGIQTRIVASLLWIHLLMIVTEVGLNAIGMRDIGLLFGLLSVAFHGPDIYSLDAHVYKSK